MFIFFIESPTKIISTKPMIFLIWSWSRTKPKEKFPILWSHQFGALQSRSLLPFPFLYRSLWPDGRTICSVSLQISFTQHFVGGQVSQVIETTLFGTEKRFAPGLVFSNLTLKLEAPLPSSGWSSWQMPACRAGKVTFASYQCRRLGHQRSLVFLINSLKPVLVWLSLQGRTIFFSCPLIP